MGRRITDRLAIDPGDIQWLAGLLEGEGCFWLKKPSGPKSGPFPVPAIKLAMTDRDVVERAAVIMGGNGVRQVSKRKNMRQEQYQVDLTCRPAVDVMRAIRPYMGERRGAKIDGILAGEWVRGK